MDYRHGLQNAPFEKLDHCKNKAPSDRWMNASGVPESRRSQHLTSGPWSLTSVWKIKILSFFFALMVTVLIMASYILARDQKGLFLTPSPYHLSVTSHSASLPLNLSSMGDYSALRDLVRRIVAKVDFLGRRVPDLGEVREKEPSIFSAIPRKFLPYLKNPCWYERFFGNITANPYRKNLYTLYSKRFQAIYNHLHRAFPAHLHQRAGRQYRLRCLPFFYIIGQPKCGTTDLYDRLRLHPEVHFTTMKEPHWWTRKRFEVEPPFLVQDFIHALQPDAKIIVMLRDPVESRLYSDYLYFGMTNKTVEDFHERVSESLHIFDGCLAERSIRSCVYNTTLYNLMPVRLQVGLYVLYLCDWLSVFSRDQILILRLEDHAANRKITMRRVFEFLQLGPLTLQKEADITKSPASNTRRPANRNLGPMLPITREILQRFYKPFSQRLAQVLKDPNFLWM
ncbi:hypothetical protein DNTS_024555 [Danionella cerebrum]|uniref:Sulfotransferase n=1 Tax=Danionella cerebrum TaxID=2873325 RepID=A0A553QPX0_9TELE|nr:hypothetical protein DNTS_024555 [Danionella translucida]